MSASSEKLGCWDGVRSALAEIGACHGEFDRFFSGVFDDFDRMTNELADRQRDWVETARTATSTAGDAELHEAVGAIQRDHADIVAAIRGSLGPREGAHSVDQSLTTVLSHLAKLTGELVDSQSEQKRMFKSQQALLSGEIASVRHLLEGRPYTATLAEPPAVLPRRNTVADPALDAVLAQFERIETELIRNRDV